MATGMLVSLSVGNFYLVYPSPDGFLFFVPSSWTGKSWLRLPWKSHSSGLVVLFDNPRGGAYSWSKCCRSLGWGLANICLDRTRMSRGMNVPRHWVLVTRRKQVGPGESQRLLHDLLWPPIFSCFTASYLLHTSWCAALQADAPPTLIQSYFSSDSLQQMFPCV